MTLNIRQITTDNTQITPHSHSGSAGRRAGRPEAHLWVVWPAPAPEAVSAHCPSDRTHTFMHSPCENDHQPPRQPLMEAGDWRSCLCLNSSHGRVPRVETVIFLLQKHLGNGRCPGSSILITSCSSQRGRSSQPVERPRWQHRAS